MTTLSGGCSNFIRATGSGTTFGIQGRLIRRDLHSTAKYLVVRKPAATPIDLLVVLSLCRDGERNEPRSLIRSLEPTVGHHTLVVFPLAGKFVMLRHA